MGHSLADAPATVTDYVVRHERVLAWGTITVSIGFADLDAEAGSALEDGLGGFVTWRQEVR
jgi:hypothetical protein